MVYRLYLGILSFLACVVFVGCMSAQPLRFDEDKRAVAFLTPAWAVSLYSTPNMAYKPVDQARVLTHQNVGYVGGRDGLFRAIALGSGKIMWTVDMSDPVLAKPVLAEGDLLVGSMEGKLYRVNRSSGEVLWTYDVESSIVSQITVDGGRVFLVNNKNALFALDVKTGKYLWHKNRAHKTEFTMDGQGAPLAADGRLYAGFSDGSIVCMAQEDGASIWSRKLGRGDPRFGDVDADPVRRGDKLFVSSFNGGLFALNPEDGSTLWHLDVTGASTPVFSGGQLIITTDDGELVSVREATGVIRWRSQVAEPGNLLSPPVRANGYVITADGEGLVVAHSNSGSVLGKWSVGDGFSAEPSYANGNLYTISNGGVFYRFRNLQ